MMAKRASPTFAGVRRQTSSSCLLDESGRRRCPSLSWSWVLMRIEPCIAEDGSTRLSTGLDESGRDPTNDIGVGSMDEIFGPRSTVSPLESSISPTMAGRFLRPADLNQGENGSTRMSTAIMAVFIRIDPQMSVEAGRRSTPRAVYAGHEHNFLRAFGKRK
jgi:hypothetical protein